MFARHQLESVKSSSNSPNKPIMGNFQRAFGLFGINSRQPIPLKSIDINVSIEDSIARVEYKQSYINNTNTLLEVEYFFPIAAKSCYDTFEAKINDKVIKGVIKEKAQAKAEYKENLDKGNTVAYSEINEETGDIIKISLGNTPPDALIEITYSYLEPLSISMNKFWKFTLYSTITPRYLSTAGNSSKPTNPSGLFGSVQQPIHSYNSDGVKVLKGQKGHYYCGRTGLYQCKLGCDGTCGPDDGCNCPSCSELDKFEKIKPWQHFTQNKDGFPVSQGERRNYYCGRTGMYQCNDCDGTCGPTDGCSCYSCRILDQQEGIPPWVHKNRDNAWVKKGQDGHYYCGRTKLYICLQGCDGQCGPTNGCNCPACAALDRAEGIPLCNHNPVLQPPRYGPKPEVSKDMTILANYPFISSSNQQAFPWKIKCVVSSSSKIQFLRSSTHEIITMFGNEGHTCEIELDPAKNYVPNKDFTLLFKNEKVNAPDCLTTASEEGYCAMVKFFPEYLKISDNDAFKAEVEGRAASIEKSIVTKSEFIFLLDRSGSMGGPRIEKAKEALIFFLKSLPEGSYFNIVSFGTRYTFFNSNSFSNTNSLPSTEANIEKALNIIEKYSADMGGTEIYQPLEFLVKQNLVGKLKRTVFLLTDGDVSNTNSVLKLIADNVKTTRVFTIGIGNGCSTQLIEQAALNGGGKYEFVGDGQDVAEKVISLLQAAVSPICDDFSFTVSNANQVEFLVPDPKYIQRLRFNESIEFFVFFKKQDVSLSKTKAILRMYDTFISDYRQYEVEIQFDSMIQVRSVLKLGVNKLVKSIEAGQIPNSNNKALELSLKYGILSKKTAFICVLKEKDDITNSLSKERVIVPNITSIDYQEKRADPIQEDQNRNLPFGSPPFGSWGSGAQFNRQPASMNLQQQSSMNSGLFAGISMSLKSPVNSLFGSQPPQANSYSNLQSLKSLPIQNNSLQIQPQSSQVNFSRSQTLSSANNNSSIFEKDSRDERLGSIKKLKMKKKKNEDSMEEDSQAQSYIAQPLSSGTIQNQTWGDDTLVNIVRAQKLSGYWTSEIKILFSSTTSEKIEKNIPKEISGLFEAANVWFTLVILAVLESKYQHKKGSWTMIENKALNWLRQKGIEYQNYSQAVIKLLD